MAGGFDLTATAWEDSPLAGRNNSGLIKVNDLGPDPIYKAFNPSTYMTEAAGSGESATFQAGGFYENQDGTHTGMTLTCPNGVGNGIFVYIPFDGSLFGVRWRSSVGTADFYVSVDGGEAVLVTTADPYMILESRQQSTSPRHQITHRGLSNGRHIAKIHLPSPASGTATCTLHGYIVDGLGGDVPPVRLTSPILTGLLDDALTNLAALNTAGNVLGFNSIHYYNTDSSERIVTIGYGGSIIKNIYLKAAGTDGDSDIFLPSGGLPSSISGLSSIQQMADVQDVVRFIIWGMN